MGDAPDSAVTPVRGKTSDRAGALVALDLGPVGQGCTFERVDITGKLSFGELHAEVDGIKVKLTLRSAFLEVRYKDAALFDEEKWPSCVEVDGVALHRRSSSEELSMGTSASVSLPLTKLMRHLGALALPTPDLDVGFERQEKKGTALDTVEWTSSAPRQPMEMAGRNLWHITPRPGDDRLFGLFMDGEKLLSKAKLEAIGARLQLFIIASGDQIGIGGVRAHSAEQRRILEILVKRRLLGSHEGRYVPAIINWEFTDD